MFWAHQAMIFRHLKIYEKITKISSLKNYIQISNWLRMRFEKIWATVYLRRNVQLKIARKFGTNAPTPWVCQLKNISIIYN